MLLELMNHQAAPLGTVLDQFGSKAGIWGAIQVPSPFGVSTRPLDPTQGRAHVVHPQAKQCLWGLCPVSSMVIVP